MFPEPEEGSRLEHRLPSPPPREGAARETGVPPPRVRLPSCAALKRAPTEQADPGAKGARGRSEATISPPYFLPLHASSSSKKGSVRSGTLQFSEHLRNCRPSERPDERALTLQGATQAGGRRPVQTTTGGQTSTTRGGDESAVMGTLPRQAPRSKLCRQVFT